MYDFASETIQRGLSLGARIVLGVVAAIFGVAMMVIAPPTDKAPYYYLMGVFCFSIGVACATRGRLRQFVGSTIGVATFLSGVAYLVSELSSTGAASRSEPSAYNALRYLTYLGLPGAGYAYKARFGLRKASPAPAAPTAT
jgi:drug/metabolite transporter (DMT)-like permease